MTGDMQKVSLSTRQKDYREMYQLKNGILHRANRKIFALGQSYYPSFIRRNTRCRRTRTASAK